MKIEIWSDVRCPFCYIGKRKFELALEQFDHKNEVAVEWHSFELDPLLDTALDTDIYTYLADKKGISREQSLQLHQQVTQMAADVGLEYNFDKAIVANSFDAHRLIQLAKTRGLGDAAEEALFKAYFTNGADISDHSELTAIGSSLGLDPMEIKSMLATGAFSAEVKNDGIRAQKLGIRGVPFFLINDRVAVSGAQDPQVFLNTFNKAWETSSSADNTNGMCSIGGSC